MSKLFNSLTGRFLLFGLLLVALVSLPAERWFSKRATSQLSEWLAPQLSGTLSQDYARFTDFINNFYNIPQLMAASETSITAGRAIQQQIEAGTAPQQQWVGRPAWLPPISLWRTSIQPDLFLWISGDRQIREYMPLLRMDYRPLLLQLQLQMDSLLTEGSNEVLLKEIDERDTLLSVARVKEGLGWIMAVKFIDNRLLSKIIPSARDSLAVSLIIDGNTDNIIASNQPDRIADGLPLDDLMASWKIGGETNFSDGNSELLIRYLLVFPRSELTLLSESILTQQRPVLVVMVLLPLLIIVLFAIYMLQRVDSVTNRVVDYASLELNKRPDEEVAQLQGDALQRLDQVIASTTKEMSHRADALKQQKDETHAILDSMSEGLVVVDGEGIILKANPQMQKMVGVCGGKIIGIVLSEILVEEPEPYLNCKMGEPIPVNVSRASLDSASTGQQGEVLVIHDLRERIAIEEERAALKQANEIAYQAGMAEMNASIFHNIGNTVGGLTHQADSLAEYNQSIEAMASAFGGVVEPAREAIAALPDSVGPGVLQQLPTGLEQGAGLLKENSEQSGELIGKIQKGVRHISEIIRIQQQMAHGIESSDYQHPEFALHELIEDAVEMEQTVSEKYGIEFALELDRELPMAACSRNRLLQVVINLIKNSREAIIERQGASGAATGKIGIVLEPHGNDQFRVMIRDDGIGIEPEVQQALFQYGFTTKAEGNGFGLHSVANFAKEHGGEIEVLSEGRERGCEIRITMNYRT